MWGLCPVNKVFNYSFYLSQLGAQDWFLADHSATHENVFSGTTGFPVATEPLLLGAELFISVASYTHTAWPRFSPQRQPPVFRMLKSFADVLRSKISIRSKFRRRNFTSKIPICVLDPIKVISCT